MRELGKSKVNFLKCTVTPSFYVINQKQDNCSVSTSTFIKLITSFKTSHQLYKKWIQNKNVNKI